MEVLGWRKMGEGARGGSDGISLVTAVEVLRFKTTLQHHKDCGQIKACWYRIRNWVFFLLINRYNYINSLHEKLFVTLMWEHLTIEIIWFAAKKQSKTPIQVFCSISISSTIVRNRMSESFASVVEEIQKNLIILYLKFTNPSFFN